MCIPTVIMIKFKSNMRPHLHFIYNTRLLDRYFIPAMNKCKILADLHDTTSSNPFSTSQPISCCQHHLSLAPDAVTIVFLPEVLVFLLPAKPFGALVEHIKVSGCDIAFSLTAAFPFPVCLDITVIYENNLPEHSAWSPRIMRFKEQLWLAGLI